MVCDDSGDSNNKLRLFSHENIIALIIVCTVVIVLTWYGISRGMAKQNITDLFSAIEDNGASFVLNRGGSTGYMILGKDGDAFCSVVNNGREEAEAYLKNDNCVSLDSKLTTSRCLNPIRFIATLVDGITPEHIDASYVTGSELDEDKDAYLVEIDGIDDCLSRLEKCTAHGAETFLSYGIKENYDIKLSVIIYHGVSVYTDETATTRKIIDDDVSGCGTFQLELIVDDGEKQEAFVLMSLATRSLGSNFSLGSEIYRCTPETYESLTEGNIKEILNKTVAEINKSLELEDKENAYE